MSPHQPSVPEWAVIISKNRFYYRMSPHQPSVPEWAVTPYQKNFPQFSSGNNGGVNSFNVEGKPGII